MKTAQRIPKTFALSAAFLCLALTGCMTSGKFACQAPDGVSCFSTPQVYSMTNDTSGVLAAPGVDEGDAPRRTRKAGKVATHQVSATGDALALSAPVQNRNGSFQEAALSLGGPAPSNVMPVGGSEGVARVPARVMRIWLAPWTDTTGDLHMPGYVYSEVTSRRWSIGGDVRSTTPSSFDPNGPWLPTPPANHN